MIPEIQIEGLTQNWLNSLKQPDYRIEYVSSKSKQQPTYYNLHNNDDGSQSAYYLLTVQSNNPIVLYSLLVYRSQCQLDQEQINEIQTDNTLTIRDQNPSKNPIELSDYEINMLNYLQYYPIYWMKDEKQVEILIHYLNQDIKKNFNFGLSSNGASIQLYMIIKFVNKEVSSESGYTLVETCSQFPQLSISQSEQQSQISSKIHQWQQPFPISPLSLDGQIISQIQNPSPSHLDKQRQNAGIYCAIFNGLNQYTYDFISKFRIQYIKDPLYQQKIKYLDIDMKLEQITSLAFFYYDQKKKYVVVYGAQHEVMILKGRIEDKLSSISYQKFRKGNKDSIINNIYFSTWRTMTENLKKSKMVIRGDQIIIYYYKQIDGLFRQFFNENIIKYSGYVRELFEQDKDLQDLKIENYQLFQIKKQSEDVLVGHSQIISNIEELARLCKLKHNKNKESYNQKKIQANYPKFDCLSLNNIQITRQNYENIFKVCNNIKIVPQFEYKIDFRLENGAEIRITNYAKNCRNIFLIFDSYYDILRLQTIIEDPIDLWKIKRSIDEYNKSIIIEHKIIKSRNNQLSIYLCPSKQFHEGTMEIDPLKHALDKYNEDKKFNDLILVTKETLHIILKKYIRYQKAITFAVNEIYPNFENLPYFDEQIAMEQIIRRQNQSSLSQQNKVLEILNSFKQQYVIGEYILSQIDNYNVAYMHTNSIDKMYFLLHRQFPDDQKPKQNYEAMHRSRKTSKRDRSLQQYYICLTYYDMLIKVIKDESGKYKIVEKKKLKTLEFKLLREIKPCIKRAFNIGQKYISISIPFEHIKLTQRSEITPIDNKSITNRNFLLYYRQQLIQDLSYNIQLNKEPVLYSLEDGRDPMEKQIGDPSFILQKKYVFKFNDPKLKEILFNFNLGYGQINKWRQEQMLNFSANYKICLKILQKLIEHYKTIDETQQKEEREKREEADKNMVINGFIRK